MDKKVFLALGSNIHPKKDYILKSLHWLQKVFGKMKISSIYETNPYNGLVQENYFNCVTSFFSQKDAFNVLKTIQEIEIKLGRKGIREKGQSRRYKKFYFKNTLGSLRYSRHSLGRKTRLPH